MRKKIYVAGFLVFLVLAGVCILTLAFTRNAREARSIEADAARGGDYLVRHFHKEAGNFDYLYDPVANKVKNSYNLLRHAGTTYALLSLYERVQKEEYRAVAEQALKFLYIQQAPCPLPHKDLLCVYEDGSAKLGGNALAVLAFTEHVRVTGDTMYLKKAQTYAAWIVATQNESGEFTQHEQTESGTTTDLVSEYYPGEAIFALMRLYALDHDARWLEAARKGALWLITVRDAEKTIETIVHDHWLLYGLRELYAIEPDVRYLDEARRITDSIAALQHVRTDDVRWMGGFYTPPRSTPSATRVEGLVAAQGLFVQAGDRVYAAKSLEVIKRAVPFLLRTQVTVERAAREGLNAEGARGGFTDSLDEHLIRIDYVQHNISALLGYAEILK